MRTNAPVLGYSDDRLIRPGDVLQLGVRNLIPSSRRPGITIAHRGTNCRRRDRRLATTSPIAVARRLPPHCRPRRSVGTDSALSKPGTSNGQRTPRRHHRQLVRGHSDQARPRRGDAAGGWSDRGPRCTSSPTVAQRGTGARLVPPTEEARRDRTLLRSLNPADRLARIDLALRSAAATWPVSRHACSPWRSPTMARSASIPPPSDDGGAALARRHRRWSMAVAS